MKNHKLGFKFLTFKSIYIIKKVTACVTRRTTKVALLYTSKF